jgi:glycine cleavage system regulatory protein
VKLNESYAPAMATLVITAIGDDRAGLVDALSGVIAQHQGNWDRSHMAELAGKFAGIVLVTIADSRVDAFTHDLDQLGSKGLLHITAELAVKPSNDAESLVRVRLNLVGQDHPGIVHEVSHVLAANHVSIDELETETVPAPQGGFLFKATAVLELPPNLGADALHDALEEVAVDLMVDLHLEHD